MNTSCKTFLLNVIYALNDYQDQVPETFKATKTFREVDTLVSNIARVVCSVKETDPFIAPVCFPATLCPKVQKDSKVPHVTATTTTVFDDEQEFLDCLAQEEQKMLEEPQPFPNLNQFGVLRKRPLSTLMLPLFLNKDEIHSVVYTQLKAFHDAATKQTSRTKQLLAAVKTFIRVLIRLNVSWGPKNGTKLPQVKDGIDKALQQLTAWCDKVSKKCYNKCLDDLRAYVQQLQLDVQDEYNRLILQCCGECSHALTLSAATAATAAITTTAHEDDSEEEPAEEEPCDHEHLLTHPDSADSVQENQDTHEHSTEAQHVIEPTATTATATAEKHVSTLEELAAAYSQSQTQEEAQVGVSAGVSAGVSSGVSAGDAAHRPKKRVFLQVSMLDGNASLLKVPRL